jgi:hypothetical protein
LLTCFFLKIPSGQIGSTWDWWTNVWLCWMNEC